MAFGTAVMVRDVKILLIKNERFLKGDEVGYFFIINRDE